MRILICNYEYPPLGGGGGVATADIAEQLARCHDVTVLTSSGLGLSDRELVNGVDVIRLPVVGRRKRATASMMSMLSYVPLAVREGARLTKHQAFDIVNTHFAVPTGPAGRRIAHKAGIPNVLTVHGGDLYDPSKFFSPHRHAILRRTVRRQIIDADAVVAQSENTADNVRRYYSREADVQIIPLGIKPPPPATVSRSDFGLPENAMVMVTVGRLVARKGLDRLIEAVRRAGDPRLHLVVVGSGPLAGGLADLARRSQVASQVHFPGYVSEKDKYGLLRTADFYVSSSLHEGFGLVFLEAMACGLPVVCYDHGGQTDFLEDGRTGFLIKAGHLDALVSACRNLADDAGARQTMGMTNLERVKPYFIEECARRYEALFESLVIRDNNPALSSVGSG